MAITASGASAATTPPWEPQTNGVGSLNFYNAAGTQIYGGNLLSPIAAFTQGSATIVAGDKKATMFGYTPKIGVDPGAWAGEQLSLSTTYPNAAAPGALGTSALPLVTGAASDENLATYIADFPNTDTSTTDGYKDMYQLRVKTSGGTSGTSAQWLSTDIQVSNVTKDGSGNVTGGTWAVVYPAPVSTPSVSAITPNPISPAAHGASVALSATVTESIPGTAIAGTVQLLDGATPVSGATLNTTTGVISASVSPADGDHSYTFTFTPTGGSAVSSAVLPYHVNSPLPTPTVALTVGGNNTTAGADATLTANITPTTVTGSVSFYDNGSTTPLGTVSTASPAGTYLLDLPTGFSAGSHSVVATFTPGAGVNYNPASSAAQQFLTSAPLAGACAQPGSACIDQQNIKASVPVGTLIITTPYVDLAHALDLGPLTLDIPGGKYSGTGTFQNIVVTDTRAGNLPYSVTALSSDLTDGAHNAGSTIDSQNVGLTGLTPAGSGGFSSPVHTSDNPAAVPPALPGAVAGPVGQQGLGLTPHTIVSVDHGLGTLTLNGTLTITAPTSTEPGTFTGTVTFTVG